MNEVLKVECIKKTFTLSKKQRVINRTNDKTKVAVNDLSFKAYDGEIYGLLGPNGAGKTTTLRMISTLIKPDSGSITVMGLDIVKDANEARKKIGFLTSELRLEDFFTPNYLYDFFAKLHKVPEDIAESRKKEVFDRFGINKFAEVKVAELSSGMKQKVSLAVSLVHNPEIIVFDEPTNGLDVITAKIVVDFLKELKKEGKTIIISTHIFELVEKLCDRVGIIINGKMILEGNLNDICQEQKLEDLFYDVYTRECGEE